jgi:predicted  nucleic acid-binding Zn-ribbon protein
MNTQIATSRTPRGARLRQKFPQVLAERDAANRAAESAKARTDSLETEVKRLQDVITNQKSDATKELDKEKTARKKCENRVEWLLSHLSVTDDSGEFTFPDGTKYKVPKPRIQKK